MEMLDHQSNRSARERVPLGLSAPACGESRDNRQLKVF